MLARTRAERQQPGEEGIRALRDRLQLSNLATVLFVLALAVYLVTRLVGLTRFPIYFFTDEAIQSLSMLDLISTGYRTREGVWFPTYFRNGEYYNLSLSVYLQWLPVLLFGKSATATRATSVLVTLLAALAVGIALRDIFKAKYWWTGTLFLSVTPAWFLHSRTAFETVEFVAFYAGATCAYLFYRYRSARCLYLAVFLGALAFYSYSPAQVIVPLTAVGLLLSDCRFHWRNRGTVLTALGLAVVCALPYLRWTAANPGVPLAHLHTLSSYWFDTIPLAAKIAAYFSEFRVGLSPWYWYVPNDRDLSRHLMRDYGHVMIATLPLAVLGTAQALGRLHRSEYRAVLVMLLASPAAAALVKISVTRALVFVVPAAILTALGLERIMQWIEDPRARLSALRAGAGPTTVRALAALAVLISGAALGLRPGQTIDRVCVAALAALVALQLSRLLPWLARRFSGSATQSVSSHAQPAYASFAIAMFLVLAGTNVLMLRDALKNSALWFRDYGLMGMQYGAFQIFDAVEEYRRAHPGSEIIFSPDWANGTDVVARFFLDDFSSVKLGSVRGHLTDKLPLDENTVFVLTPQEYDQIGQSAKLTDIRTERIVPFPDGSPGFYFVRARYAEGADRIFADEIAARRRLQEGVVRIDGSDVKVRHSYLDSEFQERSLALIFDDDPYTVAKTFETNPFTLELSFPERRTVSGFSIIIGTAKVRLTLKSYAAPGAKPVTHLFEGEGTRRQPELSFDLPGPVEAQVVELEVLDQHAPERAKVHIWELTLR